MGSTILFLILPLSRAILSLTKATKMGKIGGHYHGAIFCSGGSQTIKILSAETQQVRAIQMEGGFLALVVQSEGGVYK